MNGFRRRGGLITEHFSTFEVGLLESMVHQLIDLVGAPEADADSDPFERLRSEWEHPLEHDDPALDRLFPKAYVADSDAEAQAEYRRYSEPQLRAQKAADARLVLQRLEGTDSGASPVEIPDAEVAAWLKTLNALRLVLSVRLEIEDETSLDAVENLAEDDPQAFLVSVYDWLGFALETLVDSA